MIATLQTEVRTLRSALSIKEEEITGATAYKNEVEERLSVLEKENGEILEQNKVLENLAKSKEVESLSSEEAKRVLLAEFSTFKDKVAVEKEVVVAVWSLAFTTPLMISSV